MSLIAFPFMHCCRLQLPIRNRGTILSAPASTWLQRDSGRPGGGCSAEPQQVRKSGFGKSMSIGILCRCVGIPLASMRAWRCAGLSGSLHPFPLILFDGYCRTNLYPTSSARRWSARKHERPASHCRSALALRCLRSGMLWRGAAPSWAVVRKPTTRSSASTHRLPQLLPPASRRESSLSSPRFAGVASAG